MNQPLDSPPVTKVPIKKRCFVCGKKNRKMSQHYRKKHRGISDPVRAYLQDCGRHYHRSATSKDPVFDCMLCLRRFVNASDHKKKADA